MVDYLHWRSMPRKVERTAWWWTSTCSARIHSRRSSASYRTPTTPTDVMCDSEVPWSHGSKQTAGLLAWSAAATQWILRNGDQQLRNCYAPFMAVSKFRHAFFQVTASRKYFWPFKALEVIAIIDWLHIPVGMGATEALVYFRYISIRSTCSGNPEQVPAARTHGAHCHFEDFVIQKN